jgi:hypothetical protein
LAAHTSKGLGVPNLAIAEYPGVPMTDDEHALRRKVENDLAPRIVSGLAKPVNTADSVEAAAGPREIVARGGLDQILRTFHDRQWSDGLPIVPPTPDRVEAFFEFTERAADEVIGTLPVESREASLWSIAVNGVMAGCEPRYMPILIAVVECISDPAFRLQDAGATPGWEPLVIVSGPIAKALDFNSGAGALRVGRQANTSIGRFLRLYLRNVCGFRISPGEGDKACIGSAFNVALAENEDAVQELGWPPFSADRGFAAGENAVTVQSVVSASPPTYSAGSSALDHASIHKDVICEGFKYWAFLGIKRTKWSALFVMSPSVAKVIASQWSKDDYRRYLAENVRMPVSEMMRFARNLSNTTFSVEDMVEQGALPPAYAESADPDRRVPIFIDPSSINIVVAGDPGRNQTRGYMNNHQQGWPVSRRVVLPKGWR